MTGAPTRVAEQRWHGGVPGAAVAVSGGAATLLPGLAGAQDVYVRAGIDLSRPADTHFTDADCASLAPAALYGCGVGGDDAPLRSVGTSVRSPALSLDWDMSWRPPCGWRLC